MSWRLAKSLRQLQSELDRRFSNRVKPDWTIGDAAHRNRASDHNPNGEGVVCAIDVRSKSVAQFLWNHIMLTKDPRVKYMIFDGKIVNSTTSSWQVRNYTGSNQHLDHIHISVGRGPSGSSSRPDLYDSQGSWGIVNSSIERDHEEDDVLKRGDRDNPSRALRKDEHGPVKYAQQQVNRVLTGRHDTGPLEPDGIFGPNTEEAVKKAQKSVGWVETGTVTALFGDRMLHRVLSRDMEHLEVEKASVVKRPTKAF